MSSDGQRKFLANHLGRFRESESIDLCIANGENAAGGAGLTAKTAREIQSAGVDAITLGDHVWDQKNFDNEIDDLEFVSVSRTCRNPILAETGLSSGQRDLM